MTVNVPAQGSNVHKLFSSVAARFPERRAVNVGVDTVSYAELDRQSSRLAALLIRKGVKADSRVALFLDRSVYTPNHPLCALQFSPRGAAISSC